jgi:hypothetical protein
MLHIFSFAFGLISFGAIGFLMGYKLYSFNPVHLPITVAAFMNVYLAIKAARTSHQFRKFQRRDYDAVVLFGSSASIFIALILEGLQINLPMLPVILIGFCAGTFLICYIRYGKAERNKSSAQAM